MRRHRIIASPEAVERGIEVREGTFALGVPAGEELVREKRGSALVIRSSLGMIAAKMRSPSVEMIAGENIVHARTAIIRSNLVLTQEDTVVESIVFATPSGNVSLPPVF